MFARWKSTNGVQDRVPCSRQGIERWSYVGQADEYDLANRRHCYRYRVPADPDNPLVQTTKEVMIHFQGLIDEASLATLGGWNGYVSRLSLNACSSLLLLPKYRSIETAKSAKQTLVLKGLPNSDAFRAQVRTVQDIRTVVLEHFHSDQNGHDLQWRTLNFERAVFRKVSERSPSE